MSLYNMVFGSNPASRIILATLGLSPDTVGRFRDCFISEGAIAVYTRNGGGNRDCWHESDPKCGNETCKHHVEMEERRVQAFMPKGMWPNGKAPGNIFTSEGGVYGCYYLTDEKRMEPNYVCEEPCSAACSCPGCTVNYRLPAHPLYIRDADDEFDCTYATIYFRFPDEFADDLRKLDAGEKFDPDARWQKVIESLRAP